MAAPLRPATLASEPALFEAMLEGWRRQQEARRLTGPLIEGWIRPVRRFAGFTGAWPWQSTPAQVEDWMTSGGWAHSRVRSHEGTLAVFLSYACDPWYGWVAECEQQVGAQPVQVCHEGNTAVHATSIQTIATSVAACTCQVRGYVADRIGLGMAATGSARAA